MIHLKKEADQVSPFNCGVDAYNERDFPRAVEEFLQAVEEHPNYADYHFALAMAYRELGNLEAAIESLFEALRINPRYVQAKSELAILQAMNEQYEEAQKTYREVVTHFIYDSGGASGVIVEDLLEVFQKGLEQLREGAYGDAVVAFRQATNPKLTMPEVHFNQAVDYFLDDELEPAKIELEQALQLDPFLIDAHVLSCRIGQVEGDYEGAFEACHRAIEIAPDYPDLHYHLALTCCALDDLEQARAELERAVELRPEYGVALLELARVSLELGQLKRAEQCLEDYAAYAHPSAQYAFLLGRCYEEQGQDERARQQYEKAARDAQWEEEARSRLACLDVDL